jgi:LmbE family N-acetylglucosaminyl deacetylase
VQFLICRFPANDPEFLAKVEELSAIVAKLQPAEIYAPVPFDKWHDHEMAYEIAEQISRRMPASTRLYGYAIWMWWNVSISDFSRIRRWNRFRLNIRLVREMKLRAIDTYLTDVAPTCGISWCGNLPKNFLRIFKQDNEIFFERRE